MAKQKKYAKVHYNENEDSFELYLKNGIDGEYGFVCSSKCQAIGSSTETTHIHFSFLKEVLKCIDLGYEVFEA